MRTIVLLIFLISQSITFAKTSDDWGKTGHRTIGLIAEKHLTKKAKKAIDALLNDASLATEAPMQTKYDPIKPTMPMPLGIMST